MKKIFLMLLFIGIFACQSDDNPPKPEPPKPVQFDPSVIEPTAENIGCATLSGNLKSHYSGVISGYYGYNFDVKKQIGGDCKVSSELDIDKENIHLYYSGHLIINIELKYSGVKKGLSTSEFIIDGNISDGIFLKKVYNLF